MHKDMERQLQGYGLTTAQIIYRMPDGRTTTLHRIFRKCAAS